MNAQYTDPRSILGAENAGIINRLCSIKNGKQKLCICFIKKPCIASFRLLAAEEYPTLGRIHLRKDKVDILSTSGDYKNEIGYCPQFDAVDGEMTGREMLELFSSLRGIKTPSVEDFILQLGLEEFADECIKNYSGGNKRKLNFGISIMGYPRLILLDEPTSGVDPKSRRKLWELIRNAKKHISKTHNHSSLLLTSHSMDECEILCDKLAILKQGKIEMSGTIPEIKKKYEKGFTLNFKLKQPQVLYSEIDETDSRGSGEAIPMLNTNTTVENTIDNKIAQYMENRMLIDKHQNMLTYHIDKMHNGNRWSDIFKYMESLKRDNDEIEDYTISGTTLEEVFLTIARENTNTNKNVKA